MRILAIFLALLIATPAHAVIAVVQSISAGGTGTNSITTGDLTTTSANLIVVDGCYHVLGGAFVSLVDSKSNTYTTAIGELTSASEPGLRARQSYSANITGGATHNWTLTIDTNGYPTIAVKEASDAKTSGILDRTASKSDNTGTSGTSTATATTIQAAELVTGSGCSCTASATGTLSATGGFTQDQAVVNEGGVTCGIVTGHKVVSATASYEFTWDIDESVVGMIGMIGTYREDIGAVATRPVRRGMVLQ